MKKTPTPKADLRKLGFARVGVASPAVKVADVPFNTQACLNALRSLAKQGAQIAALPELCLTAYTCGDLFYQKTLLAAAEKGLKELLSKTKNLSLLFAVGVPLMLDGKLYNAAAVCARGKLLGIVPKSNIPNTNEFQERRWFAPAEKLCATEIKFAGQSAPVGTDLLFSISDLPTVVVGVELCEDLWAIEPPSGKLALAGANVILNLSASPEVLGKPAYREEIVRNQSARCLCAYAYANAGQGESTSDLVFSGHSLIAENGRLLAQTARFDFELNTALADVDIEFLNAERTRNSAFCESPAKEKAKAKTPAFHTVEISLGIKPAAATLARVVNPHPFVPSSHAALDAHAEEVFSLQASALATRLKHLGAKGFVIGLSGGLDSTLALLVGARACDLLKLPRSGITALTLPGLGTTARTKYNAEKLARAVGAALRTIPISNSVLSHFKDIGHDPKNLNATYENAQARERTQILMDVANDEGKIVLGTGDLSEAALGWCTFNGDQMSMYHVNAGVPKTLVRHVVAWAGRALFVGKTAALLEDILNTPISPELLPAHKSGKILQCTEQIIGPYELHDFFLFYTVRRAAGPEKILLLAQAAFKNKYTRAQILDTLGIFCRRFFSQQFKRSAMPDAPKIGSVALSARGDWRMPSDASATLWLNEIRRLKKSAH